MYSTPPTPPSADFPTAQPPGADQVSGDQPVTQAPRVSPVVASIVGAAAGAVVALAIALPLTLSDSASSDVLTDAVESCGSPEGIALEDGGATLVFDHRGEDDLAGGSIMDILCVFAELDMPTRISTHMDQTTSLDGRQTESWDGLEIQWSYHPDRGMDGVITIASS